MEAGSGRRRGALDQSQCGAKIAGCLRGASTDDQPTQLQPGVITALEQVHGQRLRPIELPTVVRDGASDLERMQVVAARESRVGVMFGVRVPSPPQMDACPVQERRRGHLE